MSVDDNDLLHSSKAKEEVQDGKNDPEVPITAVSDVAEMNIPRRMR
jgi:hypothetical protein